MILLNGSNIKNHFFDTHVRVTVMITKGGRNLWNTGIYMMLTGNPLGRTIAPGEKPADGEYYVCCEVWVIDSNGRFLITKRHPDKKAGNMWEFCGGGTLSGETATASTIANYLKKLALR